jgi:hypothetical protein
MDQAGQDPLPQPVLPHAPYILRTEPDVLHQAGGRALIADEDIGLFWIEVPLVLLSAVLLVLS